MLRYLSLAFLTILLSAPATAHVEPFPQSFHTDTIFASNVTGGIVPNSGHWIMEENPQATAKLVSEFLRK